MAFEVGDNVVYPRCGVGLIKDIASVDVDGDTCTMYMLTMLSDGSTIGVNIDSAGASGLRLVVPGEAVDRIYGVLKEKVKPAAKTTWNRRRREYEERLMTGDPLEVAGVLRDLSLLKKTKTLSFGERNMYEEAQGLVVQEVAVARDVDEAVVRSEIEAFFNK